ncbi:alpha/beta fold hydrolase [Aureimonas sp. AU4]|uniref:alpha/beta fold hydrolase n=1 Tax=Aureimonas sp. AU4 TaxID=1638163 RepID=UPI000706B3CA|nr:alpha/beta fold hydrolase [Aureimonas sp. AU4]BAT30352.1 lipase [Aureimonas sp. AU4]
MAETVRKRAVFFIGGYDPKTPDAFFERFQRELSRSDKLWNLASTTERVDGDALREAGTLAIRTTPADGSWETRTDFTFFSLDGIVLADFARPLPLRLWRYLVAFADFVASGTAGRFFAHAWRFGLYFLYPFAVIAACALLGGLAAAVASRWLGLFGLAPGLLVFALALDLAGRRWSIAHLMDLWSFSREHMRGQRPEAEALMRRFSGVIRDRVAAERYDEVLLVGHSTGGMIMLEVAALYSELAGKSPQGPENVVVLTLGSTALKAGYHPAARRFRERVRRLIEDRRLAWVEIQCLTDVINFYKTDPVAEMGLGSNRTEPFPIVRTIKIRSMLQADTYRRIRRRLFRVHYQYVFANTKPYWYDFFQIVCGPVPLVERTERALVGSPSVPALAP